MLRSILEWIDRQIDNLDYEDNLCLVKAYCLGTLNGIVEVFMFFGAVWFMCATVSKLFKVPSFMNVYPKK